MLGSWFRQFARVGFVAATLASGAILAGNDAPKPGDDATFRPTVMIHRGATLGTGTIVASVEGETLVLTASHVLDEPGPVLVELFRYNLGLERERYATGFPRLLPATIAARDPAADLAVLRVKGQLRMPYVARIDRLDVPEAGLPVTTIGFDRGERLIGFDTKVRAIDRIDMNRGGGERPFVITEDPPEFGRSGGGLFGAKGTLVGVCVGKADIRKGKKIGIFSTVGNVRDLLRSREGLAAAVARPVLPPKPAAR